jgi:hypothetical protein
VAGESRDQQVLEALEFSKLHRVPGFNDDFIAVRRHVLGIHGCTSSSGGFTPRNVQRSNRSSVIFSAPQITRGAAQYPAAMSAPASAGLAAEASPRGTDVTPAAAERSAGETTAIT